MSNDTMKDEFVYRMISDLTKQVKHTKLTVEKLAGTFGIKDKTEVKEYTELAIVRVARSIAVGMGSREDKYAQIVSLYEHQVNISHRTSQSILLQQYSTPAPISYLAGVFAGLEETSKYFLAFEPSAGNGLLTVAGNPEHIIVNEIDGLRRSNLEGQGYKEVLKQDATEPFTGFNKKFDSVISNPPFGPLDYEVIYDRFAIGSMDQLMALRALDTMKNYGKAAIIIGGHTEWDVKGRVQAGKNRIFYNYLYRHYHVADIILINGSKLYSRQGTAFNTRLILVNGRKEIPEGVAPVRDIDRDVQVRTFEDLYDRVMDALHESKPVEDSRLPVYRSIKAKYKDALILLRNGDFYEAFNEDAEILSRVTKTALVQKDGYKISRFPSQSIDIYIPKLVNAGIRVALSDELQNPNKMKNDKSLELEAEALALELELLHFDELDAPYVPGSEYGMSLNTVVPDSMAFETHEAIHKIKIAVGGNIDEFVRYKLNYPSMKELADALSAEQIDAVAMAIYNIEGRGQGMIIGDQTGIGKGRVAAGMIRYAVEQGYKPIFITEKANLFSDLYRDLVAIGSSDLAPFIVNGKESKTDIKDEDGEIVYQALPPTEQSAIFKDLKTPGRFNFVMSTYSQFNSPDKKPDKPNFLRAIAEDNIVIMDESHNSSGSSNTGEFMQSVIATTLGVVFLSATFAKRPDNMPVYAMKTAIRDANMTREELVEAITKGGVALQEILSSQLVAEGQMLRRERSFEGVEVNYITLDDKAQEHFAIADNITDILREIIRFQEMYIDEVVEQMDDIAVAEGKEVNIREGTSQAGVDSPPYFSKVFNVINQMLFSIKAEAVADRAIMRLKEGKKPVIAFSSTMGSFIEDMENDMGLPVGDGDTVNADFAMVLQKGLDGIMRYTETLPNGEKAYNVFSINELSAEAQVDYVRISQKIRAISTGITISPIDIILRKIKEAGYTAAEVTGRKYELQINSKTNIGLIKSRKKINTNDAFRMFNNNEVDVLLINQSGSTGASAHAIPTAKVPKEKVKQRVMIVLQAELDINTEVQKRGRINRTGQIMKPIYDYVNSAIPAEKRLMMMLQKKLKSLDANTTSNQKQSTKILDVPDFLNKYGDKIVIDYLKENTDINIILGDPLNLSNPKGEENPTENASHKVSGRVAVLSTKMQQDFYTEIAQNYIDYVDYLKQIGEYDLEVEAMNLEAEQMSSRVIKVGSGGDSEFGDDSILEKIEANVLKKPFTRIELNNLIHEGQNGKEPKEQQNEILLDYNNFVDALLEETLKEDELEYAELIRNIPNEKKVKKILKEDGETAYQAAIRTREKELAAAEIASKELTRRTFNNRRQYLTGILDFFYRGRCINFPIETYDKGQELIFSVFIGFMIDRKKKNPFAPSSIKLRFALANSSKYISIPASLTKDINSIKGASISMPQYQGESLLLHWDSETKESTSDRQTRYVITGNLLQAFAQFQGKLVSYTTIEGGVKKGILMPEYWLPEEGENRNVSVPIERAINVLLSMSKGGQISANNNISIFRQWGDYKIVVPASKTKAGDIFLDPDLLALVNKNIFEKVADRMTANVSDDNIRAFVKVLQDKFSVSISLTPKQFSSIQDDLQIKKEPAKIISLTNNSIKKPENHNEDDNIFEMEALALELELELLNFAA